MAIAGAQISRGVNVLRSAVAWYVDAAETDASGRVSINVPQGARVTVDADWPGRRAPTRITIDVPVAAEYDIGALLQS